MRSDAHTGALALLNILNAKNELQLLSAESIAVAVTLQSLIDRIPVRTRRSDAGSRTSQVSLSAMEDILYGLVEQRRLAMAGEADNVRMKNEILTAFKNALTSNPRDDVFMGECVCGGTLKANLDAFRTGKSASGSILNLADSDMQGSSLEERAPQDDAFEPDSPGLNYWWFRLNGDQNELSCSLLCGGRQLVLSADDDDSQIGLLIADESNRQILRCAASSQKVSVAEDLHAEIVALLARDSQSIFQVTARDTGETARIIVTKRDLQIVYSGDIRTSSNQNAVKSSFQACKVRIDLANVLVRIYPQDPSTFQITNLYTSSHNVVDSGVPASSKAVDRVSSMDTNGSLALGDAESQRKSYVFRTETHARDLLSLVVRARRAQLSTESR